MKSHEERKWKTAKNADPSKLMLVLMQVLPKAATCQKSCVILNSKRVSDIDIKVLEKLGGKGHGWKKGLQQETSYQATDGPKPEASDTKELLRFKDEVSRRETLRGQQL